MNPDEYTQLAEDERTYWWNIGRLSIIETYLREFATGKGPLRILNVGCGTGGTVPLLEQFGCVRNIDVSEDAIAFMKKRGYEAYHVDGVELPYPDDSYDLVVACDVLEHIDDDVSALREWRRVLRAGGGVLLTVPAYQWLWSGHDVNLHHKRRHTAGSIRRLARIAQLGLVRDSYAFLCSLPIVAAVRFLHKIRRTTSGSHVDVPALVNATFIELIRFEAFLLRYVRLPAGSSVVALLEKSQG